MSGGCIVEVAGQLGSVVKLNSLEEYGIGMSCGEFALLVKAGPPRKDMPIQVEVRMSQHEEICEYHVSKEFRASLAGIAVTQSMREAAIKIIEKYGRL